MNAAPQSPPPSGPASAPILNSPFLIFNLFAGLALGAGGTWALRHRLDSPPASAPASAATGAHASSSSSAATAHPTATLLLPPRLAGAEAEAALAAWLALGETPEPSGSDPATATATDSAAKPADFAVQSTALRALLTVLPDELLPRLMDALAARGGDASRRLRQIAFDVWNERSAPDAARWAAGVTPGKTFDARARTRLAQQAAKTWARTEFDPAYAWTLSVADTELSRALSSALLSQLAATDPARALALAQAQGADFLKLAQMDLFNAWVALDPAAAIQAMGPALLDDNRNNWRLQEALGTWIGRDARAAVDWILAQPANPDRQWDSLMRSAIWRAGEKTDALPALAAALLARSDSPNQFSDLSSLFYTWKQKDPDATLAWIKTLPDAAQRADLIERNIYVDDPALRDPDRALPFILELPPGPIRDQKIAGLLANWARTDPDAALAWLRAHDDPALASAAARVQGAIIGSLAATDPAAALAAWQNLPAGESRAAATTLIAKSWAKTDPAGATRWMLDQLPPAPVFDGQTYAKLSPAEQLELQRSWNAYQPQFEVLSNATSRWFQKDPLGALAWAEALPDPKQRDSVLNAFGSSGSGSFNADVPDPTERAALLSRITDPALRDKVLVNHLQQWMRSDLPAARAWIESNDALSAEQAASLLVHANVN